MGKRRGHGGGHHGGAWKVAYADFVTAMMALFMVLWISGQDDEVLRATSGYFQHPFTKTFTNEPGIMASGSEGNAGNEKQSSENKANNTLLDVAVLHEMSDELKKIMHITDEDDDPLMDIEVTSDGLRITLFDRSKQPLFIKNTDILTEWGVFAMQNLAWVVNRYPMKLRIDSHVSEGMVPNDAYGPWEITIDRANASRRALEYYAVNKEKILQISGHGESQLLPETAPESESNQRLEFSLMIDPNPEIK
tara:strand:- start:81089 stop:81838 length:750 start_codon:yes stop_codon:yes gene_type:complete